MPRWSAKAPGWSRLAGDLLRLTRQVAKQAVDLTGGIGSALAQGADLVGDHGEAATLLAATGRFDVGVERQQVGIGAYSNVSMLDPLRTAMRSANAVHTPENPPPTIMTSAEACPCSVPSKVASISLNHHER